MNEKDALDWGPSPAADLRQEAERRLRDKQARPVPSMAEVDVHALLHELQVHQIELEMQNEELLRAQEALRAASDKYHDLFDFAPLGYFRLDEQGRILEVNLAGASLLGLDRSTAVKQPIAQYVASQSRARFAEFLGDVSRADGKQICEIELQRGEQPRYALLEGMPARDGAGNRSSYVTAIDVTDRKRAEESLQSANQRLTTTLERITDGFVSLDQQWRYTYVNQAAVRFVQSSREELLGKVASDMFLETAPLKFYTEASRAVQENIPVHFEEFYPEPLNIWCECHLYPSPEGLTVYFRDITDRKRAAEALRLTQEKYESLVEACPDAVVMSDLGGRILFASRQTWRLLGLADCEELMGARCRTT